MNSLDELIKKAFLSLEKDNYHEAEKILDQALNEDPENPMIYLGLLCVELKVNKEADLVNSILPLTGLKYFKRAIRFGDTDLIQRLNAYNNSIINRINIGEKERYYIKVINKFEKARQMDEDTYDHCIQKINVFGEVIETARDLEGYKNIPEVINQSNILIEDLMVLAKEYEEKKLELIGISEVKKEKRKKSMKVLSYVAALAVFILIVYGGLKVFCPPLTERYERAAKEALANDNYEKAEKLYKKGSFFHSIYYRTYASSPDFTFTGLFRFSNYKPRVEEFSDIVKKSKLAVEALNYMAQGEIGLGNRLFNENSLSVQNFKTKKHAQLLQKIIDNIQPIAIDCNNTYFYDEFKVQSIVTDSDSLCFLRADGSIVLIGGDTSEDTWRDIKKIKNYNSLLIVLKDDLSLIVERGKDRYTFQDVIDFDYAGNLLAMVKSDGTVMPMHFINIYEKNLDLKLEPLVQTKDFPYPETGLENIKNWSNMERIKLVRSKLRSNENYRVPHFVGQNGSGQLLVSGSSLVQNEYIGENPSDYLNAFNEFTEFNIGGINFKKDSYDRWTTSMAPID